MVTNQKYTDSLNYWFRVDESIELSKILKNKHARLLEKGFAQRKTKHAERDLAFIHFGYIVPCSLFDILQYSCIISFWEFFGIPLNSCCFVQRSSCYSRVILFWTVLLDIRQEIYARGSYPALPVRHASSKHILGQK